MAVSKPKESVGQTVARAKAMLAQTKDQGKTAFKGSSYEKDYQAGKYNVITSDKIQPNEQITLPTPAPVQGMADITDMANANLAATGGATYDTKTKQIVSAPPDQTNQFQSLVQSYLGSNAQAFADMPSAESRVKEQQRMLRPKENIVNSLQGQVNTITANRDAAMLSLEGQGRGQTEGFVGGEQARISREAAIRALPVQAQLAAAQDDLESARSYASQLFQAQSQDALARYNYQKDVNGTIFNYLNEEQKRTLASKEREEDRAFSVEQSNRNNLKQLSMQALEWGQGALAGEIMKLDPSSPTFDADYGDVTSRMRKPVEVRTGTVTGMGTGGLSDITAAIVADPSLFDNITPTLKGTVITELHAQGYDTSNLGTKSLSDGAIKQIADTQKALDDLAGLKTMIQGNTEQLGPIKGLQALNPWSPARKLQADVDRVRQTVGKALEGGVLRKEDEEKYKKILSTLTDTPDTAVYKIDALVSSIQRDIETFKSLQQSSGRSLDVKAPLQTGGTKPIDLNSLRTKYGY